MAAQTGIVWIDGRDLATDFAFAVTGFGGWPGILASAPRTVPLLSGPETHGAILDPRLIVRQSGKGALSGIILGTSLSDGLAKLDALKGLCSQGEVAVRFSYAPDRYCLAILDSNDGVGFVPQSIDGVIAVSLSFLVKDGVAYRTNWDGYTLSTTRVACPIGTAVSYPVVTVHGGGVAFTNPVVTVRNAAGDVVQTHGFTFSGGADDALIIDAARSRISKSAAGTITAGESYWTSGDYVLLRPCDGWPESAAYPTVEVSSATGTAQGHIVYQRRYV